MDTESTENCKSRAMIFLLWLEPLFSDQKSVLVAP